MTLCLLNTRALASREELRTPPPRSGTIGWDTSSTGRPLNYEKIKICFSICTHTSRAQVSRSLCDGEQKRSRGRRSLGMLQYGNEFSCGEPRFIPRLLALDALSPRGNSIQRRHMRRHWQESRLSRCRRGIHFGRKGKEKGRCLNYNAAQAHQDTSCCPFRDQGLCSVSAPSRDAHPCAEKVYVTASLAAAARGCRLDT